MGFGRVLISIALLAGCCTFASAQSDSIPLGDVARQKPARKAHHVYTDDNMPRRSVPAAEPATQAGDSSAAPEKAADSNSEAAKAADDDMVATRKNLEQLLTKEQNLRWEIVNLKKQADEAPPDSRRDTMFGVIEKRTAELDTTRVEITTTEQHLLELLRKQPKSAADEKPKEARDAGDKPSDGAAETAAKTAEPKPAETKD